MKPFLENWLYMVAFVYLNDPATSIFKVYMSVYLKT